MLVVYIPLILVIYVSRGVLLSVMSCMYGRSYACLKIMKSGSSFYCFFVIGLPSCIVYDAFM